MSQDKKISLEATPRRSNRENQGIPPDRLGEWLSGSLPELSMYGPRGPSVPMQRSSVPPPDDDNQSVSSYRSRSSRRSRMNEVDTKTLEIIAEMNATLDRLKAEREQLLENLEVESEDGDDQTHQKNPNQESAGPSRRNVSFKAPPVSENYAYQPNPAAHQYPAPSDPVQHVTPPAPPRQAPVYEPRRPPPVFNYPVYTPNHQASDIIIPPPQMFSTPIVPPVQSTRRQLGQVVINQHVDNQAAAAVASGTDQLASAMLQALTLQNQRTEQFIARQSHGSYLPNFSGNPLEWPLFANHFIQSTRDCGFTNAQNMARLEKALRGEARKTVQALMIVPDNAPEVMERLEQRYGRSEYVIQSLVDIAKKTPALKEDKLSTVMDFSNAICNLVTTVKALNVQAHLYNPQLIKELVDKLPDSLKLQWGMRARHIQMVTLVDFASWVNEIADAASYVTVPKFTREKEKSATTYSTEEDKVQESSGKVKQCVFCKKANHAIQDCKDFKKLALDRKTEFVKEKRLCFRCIKAGHAAKVCRSKNVCRVEGCGRRHHTLLHVNAEVKQPGAPEENRRSAPSQAPPPRPRAATDAAQTPDEDLEVFDRNGNVNSDIPEIILRVAPIRLYDSKKEKSVVINAIFDDCSTPTMLDESVAEFLGLNGPADPLRLKWTDGTVQEQPGSRKVECWIGPAGSETKYKMTHVRTVGSLDIPAQRMNMQKILSSWEHLRGVKLKHLPNEKPKLLIGQRHYHLTVAREVRDGGANSPMLTLTKLGWVLSGPASRSNGTESTYSCFHHSDDDMLHDLVKESFQLDNIGIAEHPTGKSKQDEAAEKLMQQVTRKVNGKWETGLLWIDTHIKLPQSKETALRRFQLLEKKFDKDNSFKEQYSKKIKHYVETRYAHKLTKEELSMRSDKEWYLPTFATTHPNKPGKIRVVFDAKSRSHGTSLNDALLTGPDLLVSLPGLLLKFRQKRVAFSGDITEMFHQVGIREEDRAAQRFLWRYGKEEDVGVYQLDVMMFGAVCSPFQAQYVKNRNAMELEPEYPEAARAIVSKHYMDDYLDSVDTIPEAIKMIKEVSEVHKRGGFHIGKWVSNYMEVLQQLKPEDRGENVVNLSEWSTIKTERALGLHWHPQDDHFTFRVNLERVGAGVISGETVPTKRIMLKLIMLVWDPLGFLNHFMIIARLMLQDLWRARIGWDDPIPEETFKKWKKWVREVPKMSDVKIPRCFSPSIGSATSVQLHVMADASSKAYCSVAFLRVQYGEQVAIAFVASKVRVSPLKPTSVPRLELQAAVLACKLSKMILEQLEIKVDGVTYWVDSTTVLKWIRSEAYRFQQFVANRIGIIHENTQVNQWRWVPTKQNVADDGTRETPADLSSSSRWWHGADFLREPPEHWPTEDGAGAAEEESLELKKEFCGSVVEVSSFPLPDLERFSNFTRLVRATAHVLRFIDIIMKKPSSQVLRVRDAEMLLIRRSQWESFPEEMSLLENGKAVTSTSKLYQLSPSLDQFGVIRMESRLATVKDDLLRLPIILDRKNKLTKLIILSRHMRSHHQGVDYVRNMLRQQFWIPNLRCAERKVIHDCITCRKKTVKLLTPYMGDLPEYRVQPQARSFTIVGVDYFGPFEVTVGRRHEKRYGVLFTCLTTRAIHLEIAPSLTTDSCIMAIRRMIGRRGVPQQLHSDNGTNLRGADKELRNVLLELDQDALNKECELQNIDWRFIPPSAAHMGGSWERMVRSVKTVLSTLLTCRYPTDEVLQTFFVEAECTVNCRPLTDVPVDPDSSEALTPMHFLIGTGTACQPPGVFEDTERIDLAQRWKRSQILADMFWRRWVVEYRPKLQRRKKWFDRIPNLEVGDIVVVMDETLKRNHWPLGLVKEVFPGNDGVVRVAEIKTASGTYRRPVVKLAKLGIRSAEAAPQAGEISDRNRGEEC